MSGFNLADAMRGTIGAASTEQMTAQGERTLEQIAADIVRKDQQVGLGLISIGNDLIEAKEKVEHGKWGEWLDLNVGYSERKAQMCMQVARRYGSNPQLVADLGIRKVTALMLLPAGEDEAFVEAHDVPNMSTRELEDAIKRQRELEQERDEACKRIELVEAERDCAAAAADKLKARVKELEAAPKELYRDEAAIRQAADEASEKTRREMQRELDEARDQAARALADQKKESGSDEIVDFLTHEIETSSNRIYGVLLRAVNQQDKKQAQSIRIKLAALGAKLVAMSHLGKTNEEETE